MFRIRSIESRALITQFTNFRSMWIEMNSKTNSILKKIKWCDTRTIRKNNSTMFTISTFFCSKWRKNVDMLIWFSTILSKISMNKYQFKIIHDFCNDNIINWIQRTTKIFQNIQIQCNSLIELHDQNFQMQQWLMRDVWTQNTHDSIISWYNWRFSNDDKF